ncbi:enoyl-CoA hydratase [Rhizocola hellebori]|uniref:Enoyl-CoA hydratase n=2 Tax=Rhizocola hellebori TaxID=1392758 RepID=A0A8J3VJ21_9ACTN|nr:enoyl-CoA hydratase [Rhizocola hellebori]
MKLEDVEGVTVVRMAHGKVNALDLELCQAITATFRDLATEAHRGIVLTGDGSAFSAGVDLWRIVEGGPDYVDAFIPALVDAFTSVLTCEKPVVAAVNGHAIAGGCVLTSCCDHRIMTTGRGGIGIPELVVGVPFPAAAFGIMAHAVGPQRARQMALSGKVYSPAEALELGVVDELAEPETVLSYAVSHAARLATTIPQDTFRLHKAHVRGLTPAPDYDAEVTRIWRERAADGWIADYMARATKRR